MNPAAPPLEFLLRRLERLVDVVGTTALVVLLAVVTAQVVLRYFFSFTPFFIEEVARYLMIWAALAGCALAVRSQSHIRVDFLVTLLPRAVGLAWNMAIDLAALALFVMIAYYGIETSYFLHGQASNGMQIPLSYPTAAVPLFFSMAAVFAAGQLFQRLFR